MIELSAEPLPAARMQRRTSVGHQYCGAVSNGMHPEIVVGPTISEGDSAFQVIPVEQISILGLHECASVQF